MGSYFEKLGVIDKPNINDTKLVRSEIISCSRRTDIPAFLMEWLIKQIKIGFVNVVNPFNKNQISKISLNPSDVKCWVFWSKNFAPWIQAYEKSSELFDQYNALFFNFTINSTSNLESGVKISLDDRLDQIKWLLEEFGPEKIQYRFDPIVLYQLISNHENEKSNSNRTDSLYLDNLENFEYIISTISDLGIYELIFSFATIYSKVEKRMRARGKIAITPTLVKKKKIINDLLKICKRHNISMYSCCQPDLVGYKGIKQAHCINGDKIRKALNNEIEIKKETGQRDSCGCSKSRDIGGYDGIFRCKHNCDYCYANPVQK